MPLGFDPEKVRKHFGKYVLQCALAGGVAFVFLSFLDVLEHTGLVAALGATTFMTFTMPHRVSTRARYVVGGYVSGAAVGVLSSLILQGALAAQGDAALAVMGAVAVAVAGFVMVTTNTEHPPAAGIALGLVLQPWTWPTVVFVLAAAVFLSVAKHYLRPVMIDLL
jgi:CBS-domain-containing membrane protein